MSDPANQTPTPADDAREQSAPDQQERPATQRGARYLWEMEQARRRAVRDIVEQRIQEAREEGKFDNLKGAGKPLRLDEDVWAGEKAMAYHLLKSNDVAPQELERGHEIDQQSRAPRGCCAGCAIAATPCARARGSSPATAAPTIFSGRRLSAATPRRCARSTATS